MTRILLYSTMAALALTAAPLAEAKPRHYHHDDHHDHGRARSRTIYVIENRRPVRRVVYVGDGGRYYRYYGGRRVYVTGRYFTSYPSRYYYSDGRPRVGISINF